MRVGDGAKGYFFPIMGVELLEDMEVPRMNIKIWIYFLVGICKCLKTIHRARGNPPSGVFSPIRTEMLDSDTTTYIKLTVKGTEKDPSRPHTDRFSDKL